MPCGDMLFVADTENDKVVLVRRDDQKGRVFLHSDWAQSQVYSHYGVREKWFSFVSIEVQAAELNLRLAATPAHRFRPLLLDDASGMVRGFVSPQYADVADTDVMDAVVKAFAKPEEIRTLPWSMKTDQCLYAHVIRPEASCVPTAQGNVYLGITILNSEVGYTALRVLPIMYLENSGIPVPVPQGKLYRRIHRGQIDLVEDLGRVLQENLVYAGEFTELVEGLSRTTYVDEDHATEKLKNFVRSAGGTKFFALECERTYRAQNYRFHTGMTIVEAIALTAGANTNADQRYTLASFAGIAAAHITKT